MPDIDIDFFDRNKILALIEHRIAMRKQKGQTLKHYTGIYVQDIPHNPFDNISSVDYESAEERGYQKIDFLNVSIYEKVRDESHLLELIEREPIWDLLEYEDIVKDLFHIGDHYDVVKKLKPKSVEQLAAVLAIIRPAKRYLIDKDWNTILSEVWIKPETDLYFFKKSHAIAYAMAILVQLNLICEEVGLNSTAD